MLKLKSFCLRGTSLLISMASLVAVFGVLFVTPVQAQFGPGWGFSTGSIGWGVPNTMSRFQFMPSSNGGPTVGMAPGAWPNFVGTGGAIGLGAASILGGMYGIPVGLPGFGALGGISPWGFGAFGSPMGVGGFGFGGSPWGGGGFGGLGGFGGWAQLGGGFGGWGGTLPGLFPNYMYNPCLFTFCGAAAGVGLYGGTGHYVDTGCFYSYCDGTRSSGRFGGGRSGEWYERPLSSRGEPGLPREAPAVSSPAPVIVDLPKPKAEPQTEAPVAQNPKDDKKKDQKVEVGPVNNEGLTSSDTDVGDCKARQERHQSQKGSKTQTNCEICQLKNGQLEELQVLNSSNQQNIGRIRETVNRVAPMSPVQGMRRFMAAYYGTCKVLDLDNVYCSTDGAKHIGEPPRVFKNFQELIQPYPYRRDACENDVPPKCQWICKGGGTFGIGGRAEVRVVSSSVGNEMSGTFKIVPNAGGAGTVVTGKKSEAAVKFEEEASKEGNKPKGALSCVEAIDAALLVSRRLTKPWIANARREVIVKRSQSTEELIARPGKPQIPSGDNCFEPVSVTGSDFAIQPGDIIVRNTSEAGRKTLLGHAVMVERVFTKDPFGIEEVNKDGKYNCDQIDVSKFKFDVASADSADGGRNLVRTPGNHFYAGSDQVTGAGLVAMAKEICKLKSGKGAPVKGNVTLKAMGNTKVKVGNSSSPVEVQAEAQVVVLRHQSDRHECMLPKGYEVKIDMPEGCGDDCRNLW